MNQRITANRFDAINNRVLVRNSHKLVYKKLRGMNKDVWCDKYQSVASTKLTDPKHTYKLPFSLTKGMKKQQCWRVLKTNNTIVKKKTQALVIHSIQQHIKNKTVDYKMMGDTQEKVEKLLQKLKKTRKKHQLNFHQKTHQVKKKIHLSLKPNDEFGIEPWIDQNHDHDDKQNKFY